MSNRHKTNFHKDWERVGTQHRVISTPVYRPKEKPNPDIWWWIIIGLVLYSIFF